jgi:hypothetical protein
MNSSMLLMRFFPMSQKQLPRANFRRPSNGNGEQTLSAFSGELDELEKNSLRALAAYVAQNTKNSEEEIQQMFFARFAVADIDHLPSSSYADAIRFFVERYDTDETPACPRSGRINKRCGHD